MNRQQLCAELNVSDSTVSRWLRDGLPHIAIGVRQKRYDIAEVEAWLGVRECQSGSIPKAEGTSVLWSKGEGYTDASRKVRRRVMPSASNRKSGPRTHAA